MNETNDRRRELKDFGAQEILAAVGEAVDAVRKEFPDQGDGAKKVHERNLTHRLAVHLEQRWDLFAGWNIDCEYNRDGFEPKRLPLPTTVPNEHGETVLVLPDLIVHRRRRSENLLVIEAKTSQVHPDSHTKSKLSAYLTTLHYRFAIYVSFDPKIVTLFHDDTPV